MTILKLTKLHSSWFHDPVDEVGRRNEYLDLQILWKILGEKKHL